MESYYGWCKRKFRLKYIEKIPTPKITRLGIGKLDHNEIDKFWKKYKLDLDTFVLDINNYYKKRLKKLSIEDDEIILRFKSDFSNFLNFQIRRIKTYLDKFGDDYKIIRKHFYPIISEEKGVINISDNVEFVFIIDALFYNENGNILIDWKSDKSCSESSFKKKIPQLRRYAYSLSSLSLDCKYIGIFFVKDSLYFQDKKPINYSLEEEVLTFVRDLQKSDFPKVPKRENWKCSNSKWDCEYYDICGGC